MCDLIEFTDDYMKKCEDKLERCREMVEIFTKHKDSGTAAVCLKMFND